MKSLRAEALSPWFALLVLVAACGGNTEVLSSSSSSSGAGGNSAASSTSGSGGAGAGSMAPPDAGEDAPSDAGPPPEGGAPDPGSVLCNGVPCASMGHYCCDDPAQGMEKCVLDSVSACGGLRRKCDEAADCPNGQVCCIPPNQAIFIAYNTVCVDSCAGDPFAYQVCKSDAECENKMPCVTQLCHGETIQSCGALPANRCQ